MLPKNLRNSVFESLSLKTMRYVDAVPTRQATGLLADLYQQFTEDFFINGSLTSHSAVPELLAGVWAGGRETIIQADQLDQMTKEAMAATLSRVNDCAYCGDMLISLVHSAGELSAAKGIFRGDENNLQDKQLEQRLQWVAAVASPGGEFPASAPFSAEQMPEAIGSLVAMSHINRYSHVVMDGSPVPFGQSAVKYSALSLFSLELKEVVARDLQPGRSLELLPAAELPQDMSWAQPNPRIADAMARWSASIDRFAKPAVPTAVQDLLRQRVENWQGEAMPLSRSWVQQAVADLDADDHAMAALCLVVALSPWQFSDDLIQPVIEQIPSKTELVKILNFAAFAGARRLGERLGQHYGPSPDALACVA